MLQTYLLIAVGSALGGMARYWCYGALSRGPGATFPWATLFVNVIGCAFIGFFATITGPEGRILARTGTRQFVMIGICGGFTTFSTFGYETLSLARDGQWMAAAHNIAASVILCLFGVWAGAAAAAWLNQR